ncbi:unnamed protein product, partial [Brugia timori]|uniref:Uncharacterized protein n=1 Tax=Brugia timori TaxID=42155 RepID=A0A0R3QFI7_9BILA
MVPQAPLMLTSASPGQFMLVHHNGQCYMMSATQYFGTNQQIAAVRPLALTFTVYNLKFFFTTPLLFIFFPVFLFFFFINLVLTSFAA